MTHSTPMIMGNPNGAPHSTFVNTKTDPTAGYYDDGDADFDLTRPEYASEMPFHDTLPSMPAPLYGTAIGRHRYLLPPRRRVSMLITAIALVSLCAALIIFFVR